MTDLVERVARMFCSQPSEECSKCNGSSDCWYMYTARAAIAVVLEEAAKVAGAMSDKWDTQWREDLKRDSHLEGQSDGAHEVASAIRAMIPKGGV